MGICQLVKAGESIPGRGNYRQRGRRQFHKFENPKVLWSGWYTGYKGEDVEKKAGERHGIQFQMNLDIRLNMVVTFLLVTRGHSRGLSSGVAWPDLCFRKITNSIGQMHWKCL